MAACPEGPPPIDRVTESVLLDIHLVGPNKTGKNSHMSEEPRQAVVIIHGIGEQRPMVTLRSFVKAVVGRTAASKPDRISPTLELRRMAVPASSQWEPGQPVSTDFYELYWAHLMTRTSWNHVAAWGRMLMFRSPKQVPAQLLHVWLLGWAVLVLLVAAAIALAWLRPALNPTLNDWPLIGVALSAAIWVVKWMGNNFGLQHIGDAARYLSPTPPNIGVRHAIRSAAIDLLEGLHNDPQWHRYHRIIVVGHSLGSVIGYDALTHLWQDRHHPVSPLHWAPQPDHDTLQGSSKLSAEQGRTLQSAIWREQRAIGVQWKITDFITLGSPLAHAPFLLAKNQNDFDIGKEQREFPVCPPQKNDARDWDYGRPLLEIVPADSLQPCKILHHAALFACTRWTNLYFSRDFIGGSVKRHFGDAIAEPERTGGIRSRHFFPHTRYWHDRESALTELKKALELDSWWTQKMPRWRFVEETRKLTLDDAAATYGAVRRPSAQ